MYRALAGTVDEVGRVAAAEGIDCDFAKGGTVSLARTPAQVRRARTVHGLDETFLEADEARAICGASGVLGGTYSPHCAVLQPAALVHGLAAAVARRGTGVYGDTRALSVRPHEVVTDRGVVRAEFVVRALEGYTAGLTGYRRTLAPVYSLMIVTDVRSPRCSASTHRSRTAGVAHWASPATGCRRSACTTASAGAAGTSATVWRRRIWPGVRSRI
jgi:glycine/D-amino acid oxidase-like deaminating enzyme